MFYKNNRNLFYYIRDCMWLKTICLQEILKKLYFCKLNSTKTYFCKKFKILYFKKKKPHLRVVFHSSRRIRATILMFELVTLLYEMKISFIYSLCPPTSYSISFVFILILILNSDF